MGLLAGLSLGGAALATDSVAWFAGGQPTPVALEALAVLAGAASEGLEPEDYEAAALQQAVAQVQARVLPPSPQLAERLTVAMARYLADLRGGRIDPRQVHENFAAAPPALPDALAFLSAAVQEPDFRAAVARLAPSLPLYGNLRRALARYRQLAADPGAQGAWQTPLPPLGGRKLEPGQAWSGMALLMARLAAVGDLPAGTPVPLSYGGAVVEGVKAFQQRHGLEPDGVIGKGTLAQLNVPPAARIRQIEVTLERLRWTPLLAEPRMIVVNIPEFVLRAYEVRQGKVEVKAAMKVIVGNALNTRTPVFDENMRFIEFSPYWNVPPSIARDETVPKLRRDPHYFEQQDFEFVGDDGRAVRVLSDANLEAVLRGQMRIRQRPGPKNALGDIKFVFPNNDHIYLHHTPTPQLFKRDRRDFSHGCIRVEDPVALAKFVLANAPEWTEERILASMAKGESATLRLPEPLRVLIAYSTVIAKSDGRVQFFRDIYGHDQLLDEALRQRSAALRVSRSPAAGAQ